MCLNMTSDPKVTNAFYELKLHKKLRLDLEFELGMFGVCSCLEDLDIGGLLIAIFLYFSEFVVDFKISRGDDLEDGITIIFEVENFIEGLIFGLWVGKAFCGEEAETFTKCFEALDEDSLPVLEVGLALFLWHYY